jgi:hypothetical protein
MFLRNHVQRPMGFSVQISFDFIREVVLQSVPDAICWRCKQAHRRGDNLVHIEFNSEDTLKPHSIYHYRCIPPARWKMLAGSLPAWELPHAESPVENTGTSSAAVPTS